MTVTTAPAVPLAVVKVDAARGTSPRFLMPNTYGPLGARVTRGAAQGLVDAYADVREGAQHVNGREVHVTDGRVEQMTDLDTGRTFHVAVFEYDGPVRTPAEEAAALVYTTSDEALLTTFAALTHQIHQAGDGFTANARTLDRERHLRQQRDQVQAEILRRMSR